MIIPSFTNNLKGINEAAIRHDVRKQLEYGFAGALLVSEVTITQSEYRAVLRDRFRRGSGATALRPSLELEQHEAAVEGLRIAEETGDELVLLSYPPNFYPLNEEELYDYSRAICDATSLAVMLFPVGLWGFSDRIHPSDVPVSVDSPT